jgi:hypothetical protein
MRAAAHERLKEVADHVKQIPSSPEAYGEQDLV